MQIQGDHHFAAPPDLVWQQLMDPDALRATIPGCEKFTTVGPDSYDMIVKVGISAIRGTYTGNVTMRDPQAPSQYRLKAGGGGKAGKVEGDATIRLVPDGDGTVLTYVADVQARGPIARLGSRLVGSAAKMMAGRFFKALDQHIEQQQTEQQGTPVQEP